jgi:hypothetical protein
VPLVLFGPNGDFLGSEEGGVVSGLGVADLDLEGQVAGGLEEQVHVLHGQLHVEAERLPVLALHVN